jgi:cold shock CspA family protein
MSSTGTPDVSNPVGNESEPSTFGRVKWFNNKAGYGFITITQGEHDGSDVFVHHSAIEVSQEQYRYLVQGEYVEFKLCVVQNDTHKWQAGSVKGINNGKLMCETRLESRENRATRKPMDEEPHRPTRSGRDDAPPHYRVRTRGPGPRDGDEWMLVRRRPARPQTTSPTKEVLRSRPKAPTRDNEK